MSGRSFSNDDISNKRTTGHQKWRWTFVKVNFSSRSLEVRLKVRFWLSMKFEMFVVVVVVVVVLVLVWAYTSLGFSVWFAFDSIFNSSRRVCHIWSTSSRRISKICLSWNKVCVPGWREVDLSRMQGFLSPRCTNGFSFVRFFYKVDQQWYFLSLNSTFGCNRTKNSQPHLFLSKLSLFLSLSLSLSLTLSLSRIMS